MTVSALATPVASLTPYNGPWTSLQAGHLLRRATFAPLKAQLDEATLLGLQGTLDLLFADTPMPAPPVYYDYADNPYAGVGESWVDHALYEDDASNDGNARRRSVEAWFIRGLVNEEITVRERMLYFWHNHFGMEGPGDGRAIYQFLSLYREFATGDFRELVKRMCVNPSMLNFLNGNSNTAANPNENFAREILELFTIGKGDLAGPGDYTNYTEQDVTELARAFTGWRTRYFNTRVEGQAPEAYFQANRHDTGDKTLSPRLGSVVITDGQEEEYKTVVDVIFQQDEVSRYLCRKLYRYFVDYEIDAVIENNVIEPMAQTLRNSNYVVGPALRQLLGSQHFFETARIGSIIKAPVTFTLGLFAAADFFNQGSVYDDYQAARQAYARTRDLGQDLRKPPSVAGWTAYYQEPTYNRLWLNTATLQARTRVQGLVLRRNGLFWDGVAHPFDWIAAIERYDNPGNPNALIAELTQEMVPQPLVQEQLDALKELLLPGLEDFVWSGEYGNLQANPNDEALRRSVEDRLRAMLTGVMQLAEFHLN